VVNLKKWCSFDNNPFGRFYVILNNKDIVYQDCLNAVNSVKGELDEDDFVRWDMIATNYFATDLRSWYTYRQKEF
jgi:hypothetical protein